MQQQMILGQIVPLAVALVMLSMGLSLTAADFRRAAQVRKALDRKSVV
jgi:predicted Na+-dependent transporter